MSDELFPKIVDADFTEALIYDRVHPSYFEVQLVPKQNGIMSIRNEYVSRVTLKLTPYAVDSKGKWHLLPSKEKLIVIPSLEDKLAELASSKPELIPDALKMKADYFSICLFLAKNLSDLELG